MEDARYEKVCASHAVHTRAVFTRSTLILSGNGIHWEWNWRKRNAKWSGARSCHACWNMLHRGRVDLLSKTPKVERGDRAVYVDRAVTTVYRVLFL